MVRVGRDLKDLLLMVKVLEIASVAMDTQAKGFFKGCFMPFC